MRSTFSRCLTAGGLSLLACPAAADDMQSTHLDITASGGYSTHPFVSQGTNASSSSGAAFARLTAHAEHKWSSERTITELIGFWEGTEYFGRGMRNLGTVRADTTHAVNERLDVAASADFNADFNGDLSNRFVNVQQPGQPGSGPGIPGPPQDQFLYGGRQYRADGTLAAVWSASERSKISGSVGVTRATFSDSVARNHTVGFGAISYDHSLSQRTTLGLRLVASQTDFDRSSDQTTIVNPEVTFNSHLWQDWTLAGSLGATFAQVRRVGLENHTTNPSFSASICHETLSQRMCANASHYAQSSGEAALIETTLVGLDWIDDLDEKQTIQLSAGYQHYGKQQVFFGQPRSDQYHVAASYSRHVNDRLSVGADVTARRLADLAATARTDISGSLFIRYRIGDRR